VKFIWADKNPGDAVALEREWSTLQNIAPRQTDSFAKNFALTLLKMCEMPATSVHR